MTTARLYEWDNVTGKCPHCQHDFEFSIHPKRDDAIHNCVWCGAYIQIARNGSGYNVYLWSADGAESVESRSIKCPYCGHLNRGAFSRYEMSPTLSDLCARCKKLFTARLVRGDVENIVIDGAHNE